jgi:4-hydroxymandelate oxidase
MKRSIAVPVSGRLGPHLAADTAPSTPAPDQPTRSVDISECVSLFDFETAARRCLPHATWEYFNSGAGDEITLSWNRSAYDRMRLRPRVLVDVSRLDTSIELLGRRLPHPILLAPAADQRMLHPEGEVATARAAGNSGCVFVLSSFTNVPVEEVAAAGAPLWFQLYMQRDRGFTRDVVARAEATGCQALCLTVDTPVFGARNRQERARYDLRPGLSRPHLPAPSKSTVPVELQVFADWVEPSLTWRDIGWLRSISKLPVLLKGVLNPDDGERAVQEGAAGVIVSNHGARNLDTVPATIDALPHVVEKVAGRIPVLIDGGIRRGTDVIKALALGANAVLIARPYLYALAVAGESGVKRVIDILRKELEMAMGLLGRPTIQSIDRSVLWDL